jgi:hypothetical protein
MNHLKKIGLPAVASMALWLLVTSAASATELYKNTTPNPNDTLGLATELQLTLMPGSRLLLESTFSTPYIAATCEETELGGKVETAGGESSHPSGALSTVKFASCTDAFIIETKGTFEVQHIAGTTNGTLFVKGLKFKYQETFLGFQCQVVVNGAFGTITGATSATGHATVDVVANVERPVCGAARIKATFTVAKPTGLIVEAK